MMKLLIFVKLEKSLIELHSNEDYNSLDIEKNNSIDIKKESDLFVGDYSKGLRQIIYVYADHTFEIYNVRE